jgi:predicted enzyme related to lactoylglutathione lyase
MSDQKLVIGDFCWIDFATPDPDGAKIFYQKIFGWKYRKTPMPCGGVYTMISTTDGDSVGGLFVMPDEMKQAGVPPHISNYIEVENADDSTKKASDLGATIKMEPFDIFDYGRMAVLIDPTGAYFSLWQSKSNVSDRESKMASCETHGMFCWQELMTTNIDQAADFYKDLLGWDYSTMDMGDQNYTVIKNQSDEIGGMMILPPEMKGVPPHWKTYFAVKNIDETIAVIRNNDGNVLMGPQDIPETGQLAICIAPDGTVFSLFQYLEKQ